MSGKVGADDGAEECGFAAAAGADEGKELAAADFEVYVGEDALGSEPVGDGAGFEGEVGWVRFGGRVHFEMLRPPLSAGVEGVGPYRGRIWVSGPHRF